MNGQGMAFSGESNNAFAVTSENRSVNSIGNIARDFREITKNVRTKTNKIRDKYC